ncbi:hypothetical protein [Corynebacterium sp. AOP12-C2-36]|uniref:hypothetical protein n=1 Tax=Corynebacterium sp. AOP12-C2-36 TaxID=3457723 RepID=UPI004034BA02
MRTPKFTAEELAAAAPATVATAKRWVKSGRIPSLEVTELLGFLDDLAARGYGFGNYSPTVMAERLRTNTAVGRRLYPAA